MLKITPLEKQAKNLKEKLPQKAQDKFTNLKNKTSTLTQELRVKARMSSLLENLEEHFFEQFSTLKKGSKDLLQKVFKKYSLDQISLEKFIYWAGIYNLVLAVCLGLPEGIVNIGLNISDHALSELLGAFLLFTAVIQIIGSRNLNLFGWAIYWEGILRCIAGLLLSSYGFFGHLGISAGLLGVIDMGIGALYLTCLPEVTKKSSRALVTGQ